MKMEWLLWCEAVAKNNTEKQLLIHFAKHFTVDLCKYVFVKPQDINNWFASSYNLLTILQFKLRGCYCSEDTFLGLMIERMEAHYAKNPGATPPPHVPTRQKDETSSQS